MQKADIASQGLHALRILQGQAGYGDKNKRREEKIKSTGPVGW
jgi:hypothetical protein